jgi:hypothetical protein
VNKVEKEVGIIAHSCGVKNPRALKRYHCRIVQANGRSVPMNELYPDVTEARPEVVLTPAGGAGA